MKLIAKGKPYAFKKNDSIAILISEKTIKNISNSLPGELSFVHKTVDFKAFKAKLSEIIFIPLVNNPNIILCGIGKDEEITEEVLRNASSSITNICRDKKIKEINIILPEVKKIKSPDITGTVAEGLYLSNYSFDKYKSKDDDEKLPLLAKAVIYTDVKGASKILREVEIICENTLLCRNLVNETSDKCNPATFASEAKKLSTIKGLTFKVYNKSEIERMKMGLLLAVNRGSKIPPQLVVLKYNGNPKSKKYFAVVGKGITFDSGGMNLKPSGHMETMRMDMSGAAAALYTIKTVADLQLKKNVYAVIPLTENLISNSAYRPGDVFKSYSGKTVEIGNTDAEGRLILADALSFTEDKLNPDYIIDMATLTGACLIALGETVAALLSTDEKLAEMIKNASDKTGDKIWQLPLYDEFAENMKSDIADIKNISSDRNAGTIMGAIFLKNFIKDTKWAHIDIAGTAWYSKPRGYRPKNATGYGVRLVTEVIKNWT